MSIIITCTIEISYTVCKSFSSVYCAEQAFPKAKEIVALPGENVRIPFPSNQSGACSYLWTWVYQKIAGTPPVAIASSSLVVDKPHKSRTSLPGVSIEEDGTLVFNGVGVKHSGTYKLECEPMLGDYIRMNVAVLFVAGKFLWS